MYLPVTKLITIPPVSERYVRAGFWTDNGGNQYNGVVKDRKQKEV